MMRSIVIEDDDTGWKINKTNVPMRAVFITFENKNDNAWVKNTKYYGVVLLKNAII